MRRRKLRDVADLERETGIERTEPPRPTENDVQRLTRKVLGPLWGRKRRKMEGWPK